MSNIPADRQYTRSHEWVRVLADGNVEVGISDHAQAALGDLVFVELPEPGRTLNAGEACAVVESVKAAFQEPFAQSAPVAFQTRFWRSRFFRRFPTNRVFHDIQAPFNV